MSSQGQDERLLDEATNAWTGADSAATMAETFDRLLRELASVDGPVPHGHPAAGYLQDLRSLAAEGETGQLASITSRLAKVMIDIVSWLPGTDVSAREAVALLDPTGELASRLQDSSLWEDTIHELYVLGVLRSRMAAELLGGTGLADIRVETPTGSTEVIEAKRIHAATRPKRVRRVIAKASKQIKASGSDTGIAVIHIDRPEPRARLDDEVPSDVEPYVAMARRSMGSDHDSGVSHVIVSWDDHLLLGDIDAKHVTYANTRRSVVVSRAEPVADVDIDSFRDLGSTVVMALSADRFARDQHDSVPDLEDVHFTDQLNASTAGRHGVRRRMVLEALRNPTARLVDDTFVLVSRLVTVVQPNYVLLLVGMQRADRLEISAAYKVPLVDDLTADIAEDPFSVLSALLSACGVPMRIGDRGDEVGRLVLHAVVRSLPGEATPLIAGPEVDRLSLQVLMEQRPDHTVVLRWGYAIDEDAYERLQMRARRTA